MKQKRTELRPEDELTVYMGIEKRLFADAIASEEKFLASFIPDCEGKHPAQVFRTVSSELIVSMNDGFGVAVGVEGVAEFFQLLSQLEIVVDLAVEDDPGAAVMVVIGCAPPLRSMIARRRM